MKSIINLNHIIKKNYFVTFILQISFKIKIRYKHNILTFLALFI